MSRVHRPVFSGLVAVFALGVLAANPAQAQVTATASIQAIALVQGVAPLTAAGVNDLSFGTVFAGTSATPANLANQAGRFDVTGEPSAALTVTFTLPLVLTGGGGNIPISFSNTDGLIWNPFPAAFTTFDPNVPLVTSLTAGGTLTVGISGTVSPPAGTTTGSYTGTITLTVAYL
jgi:hypothetical protein